MTLLKPEPETMLDDLYNGKILAYAGNISHVGTLKNSQASADAISKLCGSRVSVDLVLSGQTVVEFAQRVKACALGQAAAGIVSENVIGATIDELQTAQKQLKGMLAGDGVTPDGRFENLKYLEPVKDHRSRHASTLLVLDALLDAANQIETGNGNIAAGAQSTETLNAPQAM